MQLYHAHIGSEKMFSETISFEMNVEDKIIVIQILDCYMQLTSIHWNARSWNYYEKFINYAESRGLKNVGQMIHANRFGEFEERCAGGVYLCDVWYNWLVSVPHIQNQLSCYLQSISGLLDTCKFLWAGAALI